MPTVTGAGYRFARIRRKEWFRTLRLLAKGIFVGITGIRTKRTVP
jgi:hypothetical protein